MRNVDQEEDSCDVASSSERLCKRAPTDLPSKTKGKKSDDILSQLSSETATNGLSLNREILLCLRPIRDGEKLEENLLIKPERKTSKKVLVSEDTKSSAISSSEEMSFSGLLVSKGSHDDPSNHDVLSASRKRPSSLNGNQPKKAKL